MFNRKKRFLAIEQPSGDSGSAVFLHKLICKCNLWKFVFLKIVTQKILLKQRSQIYSKNFPASLQNRPYKTTTYCKSNGKLKLQMRLSQNYDFVFTNLFKNEAALSPGIIYSHYSTTLIILLEIVIVKVAIFLPPPHLSRIATYSLHIHF